MSKRLSKSEIEGIFWLLVVGLPILTTVYFIKLIGWSVSIILFISIISLIIWYKNKKKKEKLAYLTKKYKNKEIVNKIMNGYFWQNQSDEQLRDSLGKPNQIDEKKLKTKKREIWKYSPDGVNRFKLRITLENDRVVSWEKRD